MSFQTRKSEMLAKLDMINMDEELKNRVRDAINTGYWSTKTKNDFENLCLEYSSKNINAKKHQ